jgi:hypothetical protein
MSRISGRGHYPRSYYTRPATSGGGATGVEVIQEYDFTDSTNIDISANGTYAVKKADGSTDLATFVVSTDSASGNITGTNDVDVTNGQGIVVDVSSGGGAENVVIAVALPTTLKANFDQDYLMFEWLCSGVSMVGNNSLIKFKVSTAANMRGTPSNGFVLIKSAAASGYDSKGERQYNTSVSRSSADQSTFTGGNLHIQLLMRRHSGIVYIGTGTSFAEPYTLATSFGLGGRTWSLTRPVGQTSIPQWTTPNMALQFYCNTTANEAAATISKFRLCKFSPSVT